MFPFKINFSSIAQILYIRDNNKQTTITKLYNHNYSEVFQQLIQLYNNRNYSEVFSYVCTLMLSLTIKKLDTPVVSSPLWLWEEVESYAYRRVDSVSKQLPIKSNKIKIKYVKSICKIKQSNQICKINM